MKNKISLNTKCPCGLEYDYPAEEIGKSITCTCGRAVPLLDETALRKQANKKLVIGLVYVACIAIGATGGKDMAESLEGHPSLLLDLIGGAVGGVVGGAIFVIFQRLHARQ